MRILKYKIQPSLDNPFRATITLPARHTLLDVNFQDNDIHIWALVDPAHPDLERAIIVLPTGAEITEMFLQKHNVWKTIYKKDAVEVYHIFTEKMPVLIENPPVKGG